MKASPALTNKTNTMRFLALCLCAFGLLNLAVAGDKPSPIPLRYQGLYQTKYFELKEVLGHPEQPPAYGHTAALSADGTLGLYAGGGGADIDGKTDESFLSLWDVDKGRAIKEVRIPGRGITALALSPDGKKALTGLFGSDGKKNDTIELLYWDLESGKALHKFSLPKPKEKELPSAYICLAFAPDGKTALASGSRGTIQHLDLERGKVEREFRPGKEEEEASLALIYAGADQAFLGWGSLIHLWDLKKHESVRTFKGHKDDVVCLAVSADGKRLASSGLDDAIRVWDVAKGAEVAVLQKGPGNQPLVSMAFTGNKSELFSVWTGNDPATGLPAAGSISLWDPDAKKELWSHKAKLQGLVPIAIHKGNCVLGGGGTPFSLWDVAKGEERKIWGGHKSPVGAVAALSKGRLVSGSQEGHMKFWDKETPAHLVAHGDAVFALTRGDKDLLLSGGADKLVKLWDAKSGKLLKTFTGHEANVTAVVFGPGQKWIASAGGDRVIRTWDLESGKPIAVLSGHSEGINGLAVSPDGQWLATASDDNSVRLWPVKDGKLDKDIDVVILEGHKRQATCVAFTPDGKRLVSGSQDKTLRIWDVAKGRTVKVLEGHENWITAVLVWNDKILSTGDDFRVIAWDLKAGKLADVIDLTPYGDCPRSLALGDGGRDFYVGTSGWVIMRFELIK